jgi:hypothetical protein
MLDGLAKIEPVEAELGWSAQKNIGSDSGGLDGGLPKRQGLHKYAVLSTIFATWMTRRRW